LASLQNIGEDTKIVLHFSALGKFEGQRESHQGVEDPVGMDLDNISPVSTRENLMLESLICTFPFVEKVTISQQTRHEREMKPFQEITHQVVTLFMLRSVEFSPQTSFESQTSAFSIAFRSNLVAISVPPSPIPEVFCFSHPPDPIHA
jgi:hypothetical protein